MTKLPYFSPQSSQLRKGERRVCKQSQDSVTSMEMEIHVAEGTMERVREDLPEEEVI